MMNKEELNERIAKEERALSMMLKFRHLSNESDEEFEKKVDYYLDCLIPLYKERKEQKQE